MDTYRTGRTLQMGVIVMMALSMVHSTAMAAAAADVWHGLDDHVLSNGPGLTQANWAIGDVKPGQSMTLPGSVYFTVFSNAFWELHVNSVVRVGSGAHSYSRGSAAQRTMMSGTSSRLVVADIISDDHVQPTWTRLGDGTWVIHGESDPDGGPAEIGFLYDLHTSWDDPAGTPLEAEVIATLSQGDHILTAYVRPSVVEPGYLQPIQFWYHVPNHDDASGVGRDVQRGDTVRLSVLDENHQELAEVTQSVHVTGWQSIVWEDLPNGGLDAGRYLFRITMGDQLLGSGWLHVTSMTTGQKAEVAPLSGTDQDPKMSLASAPDLRMRVTPAPIRFAERARWTVSVINPELGSMLSAQVEICLPIGVTWVGADVPADHISRLGIDCHVHLLGSLKGRSESSFDFTVTADQNVYLAQRTGIVPAIELRLSAVDPQTGHRVYYPTMNIGAETPTDLLTTRPITVTGRAYIDINGSGRYEPGEPVVAGATIVADGRPVATTNRSGQYTASVPWHTKLLWVVSPRGTGLPQRANIGYVRPLELPVIDLPVRGIDGEPLVDGQVQVSADGGFIIGAGLRSGVTRLAWRVDAPGATLDGRIDFQTSLTSQHATDKFVSERPDRLQLKEVGLRLVGQGGGDVLSWEGEIYRGLPRTMRSGILRPSEPVRKGHRYALQAVWTDERNGLFDTFLTTAPRDEQGSALIGKAEVAYAEGDVWSCALYAYEGEWLTSKLGVTGRVSSAYHERVTAQGVKTDRAVHQTAQLTSSVLLHQTYRWPVFVEVSAGSRRQLAPSCGLSPHAGMVWRLVGSAPTASDQGGIIESIEISGGHWPQGGDETSQNPADEFGDMNSSTDEEVKYQLALRFRSLRTSWRRMERSYDYALTTEAAVQFGTQPTGDLWMRPALRVKATWDTSHDVHLELGPATLFQTTSVRPSAVPGRLQLSWRLSRGPLRPWIRYETNKHLSPTGEWGVQADLLALLGHESSEATAQLQVSRAVRKTSTLDNISLKGSLAGLSGNVSWRGRTPFDQSFDRVLWHAELGYAVEPSQFELPLTRGLTSHDLRVDYVGLSWDLEWTQSGTDSVYELQVTGRSPFGKYRLSTGTRFDDQSDVTAAYDTTSISLLYPLDTWSVAGEFVQKRDRTGTAPNVTTTLAEVKKHVTSAVSALSTLAVTRTMDGGKTLPSSSSGASTISVRRSIGLDWAPTAGSKDLSQGAEPVSWVFRVEAAWTDDQPAELVIGFSLPTLW